MCKALKCTQSAYSRWENDKMPLPPLMNAVLNVAVLNHDLLPKLYVT